MMFGYAVNETENYMPATLDLAHLIVRTLADIRKEGKEMTYLRPDSKSQVTIEYSDNGVPQRIDTSVEQQKVTVKYDADKTSAEKLQKAFKKFGYEARQVKANEKVEREASQGCSNM